MPIIVKSPEVKSDGTINFRLYAPHSTNVKLKAEGVEATPGATMDQFLAVVARGLPMTKA